MPYNHIKLATNKSLFFFLFFALVSFQGLMAQDIVGKWLVDDASVTVQRKVTEVEKQQLDVLRDSFLEMNKGVTTNEYRKDGTLLMTATDADGTHEIGRYKWWVKGNKLFTTNPATTKGYSVTYKVEGKFLYVYSYEIPHKFTITVKYSRV